MKNLFSPKATERIQRKAAGVQHVETYIEQEPYIEISKRF